MTAAAEETVTLSYAEVFDLAKRILLSRDFSDASAEAIAETLAAAQRDGAESHGLFRLQGHIDGVEGGRVDPKAVPDVKRIAPSVVRVDAKRGFAQPAVQAGRPVLLEAARETGVAIMVVSNSHHQAALWPEAEALAREGVIALSCVASRSYVVPHGGKQPVFGTNPFAFAWPRAGGKPPMVYDMASSVAARGEVMIAKRDGHAIPEGWAQDADGNPTTDPVKALSGALLPFGGYKGSAIAMTVELLGSALTGGLFSFEASETIGDAPGPSCNGFFVLVIDPSRLGLGGEAEPAARAEALFGRMLAQDGVRLPADRRYANRAKAERDGIPFAKSRLATLQAMIRD